MFVENQPSDMSAPHFFTWLAFQKAEILADKIFLLSRRFPAEERFSLTDQIRRSSRSVCANQAESCAKRRYPKHFISKLTDAQGENYETMTWLRFARRSKYINDSEYTNHYNDTIEVEKLLSYMLRHEDKFRGEFSK
jgi:four helix bundle protein